MSIKTNIEDGKVTADINLLFEWERNPRNITEKGFERLKKQIQKLGLYRPLIITPEGEVLGGNMRLKAFRELGYKEVWVSVVRPQNETEKMQYALSDNDHVGYYDSDEFFNMLPELDIEDIGDYGLDFKNTLTLKQLVKMFEPKEEEKAERTEKQEMKLIIRELVRGYRNYLAKLDKKALMDEKTYALWR